MNAICKNCKKYDCIYRNKAVKNFKQFNNTNCTLLYIERAQEVKKELETIIEKCEGKPGFLGITTQAAFLLDAANETIL